MTLDFLSFLFLRALAILVPGVRDVQRGTHENIIPKHFLRMQLARECYAKFILK